MCRFFLLALASVCLLAPPSVRAQPKPAPNLRATPQPYDQISFEHDFELARLHFGPTLKRPFIFPLIGPNGRGLTRMGHPHDPMGHSHHNSVWIAHNDVNGTTFWADAGKNLGRIVHERVEKFTDADDEASVATVNAWIDDASKKTLLTERRKVTVRLLDKHEWLLILDLHFEAKEEVTLGKTPFGMIGVRMAKSIGVKDGGGMIRNSEGKINEKEVHWKKAKWVDYSGPIVDTKIDGITLMDHPKNPNHPTVFHVRDDGWMGASLTHDAARKIEPGKALRLCYALYIHRGQPEAAAIQEQWSAFATTEPADLTPAKK